MKVNRNRILKRLEDRKTDRGAVTVYLSKSLFKRFRKACGTYSASEVMEELMHEFVADK